MDTESERIERARAKNLAYIQQQDEQEEAQSADDFLTTVLGPSKRSTPVARGSKGNSSVYITGLSTYMACRQLEGVCNKLGKVRRIKFYKDEKGGLKGDAVGKAKLTANCSMKHQRVVGSTTRRLLSGWISCNFPCMLLIRVSYLATQLNHFEVKPGVVITTPSPAPVAPASAEPAPSAKSVPLAVMEDAPECVICLDELALGRALFTAECGHRFHFSCLLENVNHDEANSDKCPICRKAQTQWPEQTEGLVKAHPYLGAASSASLLLDRGRLLALDRDAILSRSQYWRLISSQLTFHHGLAVSLGLYAVFQFRVLERQLGSRKFGSILVFVLLISGALQLAALTSAPWLTKTIPGGPYPVIGAFAVYFNKFIPKLHPRSFSVWGLHFSDKSSTYMLMLVRRALEAQRRVNARFNRGRPAAPAVQGQGFRDQLLPGAGGMMPGGAPAAGGMLPPHMAAQPPSEDAIQQLMALGFDRERALQALQSTDNNVEAAANRLLNGL
ncbi:hypothetical protein AM588_10004567 [Phytophthora nicotianae]|uniref:Uncharacterized protein n=1 Tax=Phytophthora nicotianae TaxID=4792 RepID=A0A0W8DAG0_PHYNI|nr:hypothetical protein AM588_10004567 [Phytophthora nicotianae]